MKESETFDYQGYVVVSNLFSEAEIEKLTRRIVNNQWYKLAREIAANNKAQSA